MKESEQYIKFAFLTGVSKFSRVSVFSGLNNLRDITLSVEFSTINGYTQDELKKYFNSHIEEMAKKLQVKQEYLEYQIKRWYNGYSWDGKNFVYNPFSILYLFIEQKISNYWFQSGTPTFLLKLIKEQNIDINKIAPTITDNNSFQSYEIENLNFKSLLFQTGYLTIKNIDQIGIDFEQYTLDYPNLEVKESLLKNILGELANNPNSTGVIVNNLMVSLENKDLEKFFTILKSLFADIPSSLFIKDKEAYYHTIIYLVLTLIGVRINLEVHTNHGRIDTSASLSTSAVVETQKYIYIFEFKIGSSSKAIKQIEERKYYEKYLSGEKEILLVGVNFSIRMKNIKDFILKNINE